jgi:hypothetical protein
MIRKMLLHEEVLLLVSQAHLRRGNHTAEWIAVALDYNYGRKPDLRLFPRPITPASVNAALNGMSTRQSGREWMDSDVNISWNRRTWRMTRKGYKYAKLLRTRFPSYLP